MTLEEIIIPLISLVGGYVAAVFKTRDTKINTDKDITMKTYDILEGRLNDMEEQNKALMGTIDGLKAQLDSMRQDSWSKDVANQQELTKISNKLISTENKLDKALELLERNNIPIGKEILPDGQ